MLFRTRNVRLRVCLCVRSRALRYVTFARANYDCCAVILSLDVGLRTIGPIDRLVRREINGLAVLGNGVVEATMTEQLVAGRFALFGFSVHRLSLSFSVSLFLFFYKTRNKTSITIDKN